jgi:hypothetical protein
MVTKKEAFPSKFFKADDLGGKPLVATIGSATLEVLTSPEGVEQSKVVLRFTNAKKAFGKALPLNATNFDMVVELTGEADSANWPGHKIELYPTTTEMRGKIVDCIRIREPGQLEPKATVTRRPAKKSPPPANDAFDDEVPFTR